MSCLLILGIRDAPTPEPLGLRSISFNVDKLEETALSLDSKACVIKKDWFGEKYLNITDPDGNVIQLHEK